jgi:hypothetical protein
MKDDKPEEETSLKPVRDKTTPELLEDGWELRQAGHSIEAIAALLEVDEKKLELYIFRKEEEILLKIARTKEEHLKDDTKNLTPAQKAAKRRNEKRASNIAKQMLEEFSPNAAAKLIQTFLDLPKDKPHLILQFAREIMDRGMGRAGIRVEIDKSTEGVDELEEIKKLITSGDPNVREAVELIAVRLDDPSGSNGKQANTREIQVSRTYKRNKQQTNRSSDGEDTTTDS